MATLTKEVVDNRIPTQSSAPQQSATQPKSPSPGPRSDAVSLEIGVKVHGSRLNPSAPAGAQSEPFSEQTTTMIVFPQGAVVRMNTSVHVGQMLVLTNLKSRQDAICRVTKVRSFPNLQSYVEVEFTQPQHSFWGVYFSSEGPASTQTTGQGIDTTPEMTATVLRVPAPVPAGRPQQPPEAASSPEREQAAKPAVLPAPQAPKFIPIFLSFESDGGTHPSQAPEATDSHSVSAKADAGAAAKSANAATPLEVPFSRSPRSKAPTQFGSKAILEPLATSVDPGTETIRGGAFAGAGLSVGRGLGAFAPNAPEGEEIATSPDSIRHVFADAQPARATYEGSRPNWILIGACAALLFLALVAGVWYFSAHRAVKPGTSNSSSAAVQQQPAPSLTQTPGPAKLSSSSTQASSPNASANSLGANFSADSTPAELNRDSSADRIANGENDSASAASQPSARPARSAFSPKLMKAHPLISVRNQNSSTEAPALDASAVAADQPAALPGILASSLGVPLPPNAVPGGPVSVGGLLQKPKVVSSVQPVYPIVAKQAHVQGDVVIDTLLDKTGNVSRLKIVSGPSMLRQAALDALSRWKFEPSQLDGQPVEVEMSITIKFRL